MKSYYNLKKKTCILIGVFYLLFNLFLFSSYINAGISPIYITIELDYELRAYYLVILSYSWLGLFIILLSNFYIFIFELQKAILVGIISIVFHIVIFIIILGITKNLDFEIIFLELTFYFLFIINSIGFTLLLIKNKLKPRKKDVVLIKRTTLDYGTQHSRLEIREIASKCRLDKTTVTDVIKEMVKNEEVYAEYFSSSKSIVFDQLANIDSIDKLIDNYKKWEVSRFGKE